MLEAKSESSDTVNDHQQRNCEISLLIMLNNEMDQAKSKSIVVFDFQWVTTDFFVQKVVMSGDFSFPQDQYHPTSR